MAEESFCKWMSAMSGSWKGKLHHFSLLPFAYRNGHRLFLHVHFKYILCQVSLMQYLWQNCNYWTNGSGGQGLSPTQLPSSHLALSPGGQLGNFLRPERSLWFQCCLGQSLDESGGQILCFSPPGQCFQSDSKQGNVLLWRTGKGIIIFHLWARVSNLSQVGKNEWLGRWNIHSFNVWSAHLHVSNQNNLPALSCFTAVPASEVSEHTKGVKYCFWMY